MPTSGSQRHYNSERAKSTIKKKYNTLARELSEEELKRDKVARRLAQEMEETKKEEEMLSRHRILVMKMGGALSRTVKISNIVVDENGSVSWRCSVSESDFDAMRVDVDGVYAAEVLAYQVLFSFCAHARLSHLRSALARQAKHTQHHS